VRRQHLADSLAQAALEHMLAHLDAIDAQISAIDHQLDEVARTEPWCDPVRWLCCFRGITTITALGLLAELGDFRRFGSAREPMGFPGLTPSEYSCGEQRHRGHITKTGPRHARRLLIEAAWHYQHAPRISRRIAAIQPHVPPDISARAHSAHVRLHHRHRTLTTHGKRPTVANVAVAPRAHRLPVGRHDPPAPARRRGGRRCPNPDTPGCWGRAAGADPLQEPRPELCDPDSRP
jgi:transposase